MAAVQKSENRIVSTVQSGVSFKKSNVLISAQYKWGDLETSIFNLALMKINNGEMLKDQHGVNRILVLEMYQIPGYEKEKNKYIYDRVKQAANALTNANILIEGKDEKGNKSFDIINVFESASYGNGKLTLFFTERVVQERYIAPIDNYTKVLYTGKLFDNDEPATKLYENLRSHCYYAYREESHFKWQISIEKLRCIMGLIDTNQPEFKKAIEKYGSSYSVEMVVRELEKKDAALLEKKKQKEMEEAKKYGGKTRRVQLTKGEIRAPFSDFRSFRRNILDPSITKINSVSDIRTEYDTIRNETGISVIVFKIWKSMSNSEITPEKLDAQVEEVFNHLNGMDMGWTRAMVKDLVELSGYDMQMVLDKYALLNKQEKVANRYGWLKAAIDRDFVDMSEEKEAENVEIDLFEKLWAFYPKKSRKDKITKAVKRRVNEVGFDRMHKAIENYMSFVARQREGGFNRAYLGGGIFFSGEFERWLDENIENTLKEEDAGSKTEGTKKNRFLNFEQVEVDYDALALKKARQFGKS